MHQDLFTYLNYLNDIADGSVWYSMPQGDRRNDDLDLYDVIYDGDVTIPPTGSDVTGWLSGGLGQLTDGEEGQPNFRLDPRGLGIKGYQWVGWRNDSFAGAARSGDPSSRSQGASLEMTWKFDAVRNFSTLRIHANNMFTRDVRVFRAARVSFSVGGHLFTAPPVEYLYVLTSISIKCFVIITIANDHRTLYSTL